MYNGTNELIDVLSTISSEDLQEVTEQLSDESKRILFELLTPPSIVVNYAQTDDKGQVIGISQLSDYIKKETHPNTYMYMHEISEYDTSILGKFYINGNCVNAEYFAILNEDNVVTKLIMRPVESSPSKYGDVFSIEATTEIPAHDEVAINENCVELIGATYDLKTGEFIMPPSREELTEQRIAEKTASIVLAALGKI